MRVLVTGGAGYLGSILTHELTRSGYQVRCLDRFLFGKRSLRDLESNSGLEVVEGDIRDVSSEVVDDVSVAIDLAAISQPDPTGQLGQDIFQDINHHGAVRLANLCKQQNVAKYIFASTCSVYGFQEGTLTEDSTLNPIEAYGETKAKAEGEVLSLSDRDFTVTALRFATLYGLSPKIRFDLVVNGMTLSLAKTGRIRVMRPGTQWRPVTHVKDVARAIMSTLEAGDDRVQGEVFNVGSDDQNFQVYQLAKLIGDSIGSGYKIEWYGEPDTRSYRVDFSKITEILGFKTKYTPVEGAREIYEALKSGTIVDSDEAYVIRWYKRLLESKVLTADTSG